MAEARRKEVLELVTQQYLANEEKSMSWFAGGTSYSLGRLEIEGGEFEMRVEEEGKEKKKRKMKGSLKEKESKRKGREPVPTMFFKEQRSKSLGSTVNISIISSSFPLLL